MDKIEKIRQEIERLIEMNKTKNGFPAGTICAVRIEAYEHLLSFIDTLSEEPDKSLEEAAEEYSKRVSDGHNFRDLTCGFKAGAEWQKQQMLKDAVESKVFMSFAPGHNQMVMADVDLPTNTKVKLIIVKED